MSLKGKGKNGKRVPKSEKAKQKEKRAKRRKRWTTDKSNPVSRKYSSLLDHSTQPGQPKKYVAWKRDGVVRVDPEEEPQYVCKKSRDSKDKFSNKSYRCKGTVDNSSCMNWSPIYGLDTTMDEYRSYRMNNTKKYYRGWYITLANYEKQTGRKILDP